MQEKQGKREEKVLFYCKNKEIKSTLTIPWGKIRGQHGTQDIPNGFHRGSPNTHKNIIWSVGFQRLTIIKFPQFPDT